MAYEPVIIEPEDYGDIRLALGFASSDTTTLPNATIEGRPFLRRVELLVARYITNHATILDTTDADYDADRANILKGGVVLGTASMLASNYFALRTGEEVQRSSVGPYTTQYRTGPEWTQIANQLRDQAAREFYEAQHWSTTVDYIPMLSRAGPTRKAAGLEAEMTRSEWLEYLKPPVIRGYVYYDIDDTE